MIMKKIYIVGLLLIGLTLANCEDFLTEILLTE